MAEGEPRGLTLPNKITVSRALLVPVFAVCLVYRRPGLGLIIFFLASAADALDGYLARTRGESTALGATLDPVADKLLMFSAYLIMGMNGMIPAWLAILVISRDALISAGYLSLYLTLGFITPEPSRLGKITTVSQISSMVLALIVWTMGGEAHWGLAPLYYLTGALTAASGVHYTFFVGGRMLSRGGAGGAAKGHPSPANGDRKGAVRG